MASDLPDPIGDALRADAEAARAEIRAAGIICPSCDVNAADLPRDHMLGLDMGGVDWVKAEKRPATAKCQAGALVPLDDASFETWQAAASVQALDQCNKAMDDAFSERLGWDIRGETPPPPKEWRGCWTCWVSEPRWTPEQVRLVSLYGTCERCGSPRDVRMSPGPDGGTWGEIACTANPCEPKPPGAADLVAWARSAEWRFRRYYKYSFTFTGRTPSLAAFSAGNEPLITATATVGGDANDIYKFEVKGGKPMTWDEICVAGEPYLVVTGHDGNVICEG